MKHLIKCSILLGLLCPLSITVVHAQQATETFLYSFDPNSKLEGKNPDGPLIEASDGNFYGTTLEGPGNQHGVVYRLTPSGAVTTICTFVAGGKNADGNGGNPIGALVQGSDGNLYGVTLGGGTSGQGTVFRLTLSGTLTTLYSFPSINSSKENVDGAKPESGLIQGSDGSFYGTTSTGGGGGAGTVYSITSSGVFTLLHRFSAVDANEVNTDGAFPRASLIQASNGNFFGTTYEGGASGNGTVFKITAKKAFETLYSFSAFTDSRNRTNADGAYPEASLLQVTGTTFYGTAFSGGSGGCGTIFKITTTGDLTTLYDFNSDPNARLGNFPEAALIKGPGGLLYGVTEGGGGNQIGAAFSITLGGHLSLLYTFGDNGGNYDAHDPGSPLLLADDGTLYGTSENGGFGTIYQLTLPD